MESELFVKSLGLSLCLLVKIEDLPSLVSTIMSVVNLDCLSFNVFVSNNVKASLDLLDVAEMLLLVNKDLPPA
jgi:hypothetical protein